MGVGATVQDGGGVKLLFFFLFPSFVVSENMVKFFFLSQQIGTNRKSKHTNKLVIYITSGHF